MLCVMETRYFDPFILVKCQEESSQYFTPQITAQFNNTTYLIEDRGISNVFFNHDIDTEIDLLFIWLSLHKEHRESIAQKAHIMTQISQHFSDHSNNQKISDLLSIPFEKRCLNNYRKVGKLPLNILTLAHKKLFSLKQLLYFTSIDPPIIEAIIRYENKLNLSASHLLVLMELLNDCCKKSSLTPHTYLEREPFASVLHNYKLTNHERTQKIRDLLMDQRLPTLQKINKEISSHIDTLNLPKHMTISWDKTLENPGFTLSTKITCKDDLASLVMQCKNQEFALQQLLINHG